MARRIKRRMHEAKTTTKNPTDVDWDTFFDEPVTSPISRIDKKTGKEVPTLNVADKKLTKKSTANVRLPSQAMDLLANSNLDFSDMDDEMTHDYDSVRPPEPENAIVPYRPVTPKDVPAVIHREITVSDPNLIEPTWHTVANLPGNMSRAIMTLGKALFKAFTKTPTGEIVMIGNVGGQGPNSTREVRGVANWVQKFGKKVDSANIDFSASIPGYNAQIEHYTVGGVRFKLVKDDFGEYIYCWPEQDSVNPTSSPSLDHQQKAIKEDEFDDEDGEDDIDPIFRDMDNQLTKMNVPDDEEIDQIDRLNNLELKYRDRNIDAKQVPAVANALMSRDGFNSYIRWTMIGQLQGFIKDGILKFGKSLFSSLTHTPIYDIAMIGNIGGYGPNSNSEIESVIKWLRKCAKEVGKPTLNFGNTMPGYHADATYYTISGLRFMTVIDAYGTYCYVWPENESEKPVQSKMTSSSDRQRMNENKRSIKSYFRK